MGKGAGGCLGKSDPTPAAPVAAPAPTPVDKTPPATKPVQTPVVQATPKVVAPVQAKAGKMTVKIYILYYSTWGHIAKLAQAEKEGVDSVEGVEAILYQLPETLPQAVLDKMHAAPKNTEVPVADVHDLPNADGYLIGFPTRYGMPAAQFKSFWDATGSLWQSGALVGKAAGFFFSTASQGGGQETTALTAVTQLVHHGIIFVPPGYSFGGPQFKLDEPMGGSPYGAGTFAGGDGSRQPSADELAYAKHQGTYFAKVVKKLAVKTE